MIRELLAWVVFLAIVIGGAWFAIWFDQHVVEPAIARASANALGVTVEEYRDMRRDFWKRQRARLHVHWWRYDGWDVLRGGIYRCRCRRTEYGARR